MDFEILSWTEILDCLKDLALKILQARKQINVIVSIGRGGNCPSRILSDFLNVQNLYNINVRYYKDINKKTELPAITQPLIIKMTDKNVLLCDDVSDSGNSLKMVKATIQEMGCASLSTATIYIKPWTKSIPDFYSKQTKAWIVFPWEYMETLEKLTKAFREKGLSSEAINRELLSSGFDTGSIDFYLYLQTYFKNPE
ncbi:MAG: phosphoribosyltransferase [Candidatus Helarchaeota archaeon]|nr:phosphoribosyltransferase [Candidatus Helarchaeota archaeon]